MSDLKFLWSNSHQLFYMLGNIDSYRLYPNIPFNRATRVFQVSHGNLMSCYVDESDLERYKKEGELFLDKRLATKYLEDAKKQCADHQLLFSKLENIDYSTSTKEELLSYWDSLIENYAHSVAYFRSTQDEPSQQIVRQITNVVSGEDAQKLLLSPELDEINKEEVEWEKLIAEGFTREKAKLHLKNFPWLFQNTLSYDETINELGQRVQGHLSRDIKKEKEELRREQAKLRSQYPEINEHIDTLQELALLRPLVKVCWGSTGYYVLPILIEISNRYDIDLRTLTFLYRSEDIQELLKNGTVLAEEDITERKTCTAYLFENNTMKSFVGARATDLEKQVLDTKQESEHITELKGSSARPGIVKGTVHILTINDPEATKKFRESFSGGILVTSMTQPNVVDIAKRASAIITDEGGMLCHAAIIAREFGIPCVVGTHKATKVLSDGMTVEVNANTGVVTIL